MFGTIIFGTQIMFGTSHQLFLMHCTEHKLLAEDKMRRAEHTFGAEHIVPKFNGAEVRIPRVFCNRYFRHGYPWDDVCSAHTCSAPKDVRHTSAYIMCRTY